jgi:tetratricopeptide (TPR) repeat protein
MHALEGIGELKDAVSDGALLVRLVAAVPHAHHMYGHELRRAGRAQDAIAQFKEAERLEVAYYRSQNILAEYDWHHMHNLNLLASAYLHEGELASAEKTLRESVSTPSITVQYAVFKEDWPEFLLLRGRSQEALTAARELTEEKWPQPRVIGHALAGEALLAMGDRAGADAELQAAQKEVDDDKKTTQGVNYHVKTLAAELLLGTAKSNDGIADLEDLEAHFGEAKSPDEWNQGLFQMERIARMARQYNSWELAKETAEHMLKMDPYYAGSHFALAQVYRHEQDDLEARREFDAALRCWQHSDSAMPEYVEALQARVPTGYAGNQNRPR